MKVALLLVVLLYCVYVSQSVNIKALDNESALIQFAFMIGLIFAIPAFVVVELLPESMQHLDGSLLVAVQILDVFAFVGYVAWLIDGGTGSTWTSRVQNQDRSDVD